MENVGQRRRGEGGGEEWEEWEEGKGRGREGFSLCAASHFVKYSSDSVHTCKMSDAQRD